MNRTKQATITAELAILEAKADALLGVQNSIEAQIWDIHNEMAALNDTLAEDRWLGRDWTNGSK